MALADAVPFAVAAWNLDEESGTRVDQVGSNDLTDNNTVLFGTGKFGNAADIEKSNAEYLSITDNAALSMGDIDFMIRFWIKPESFVDFDMILTKYAGTDTEYRIFFSSGRIVFQIVSSGGTSASATASNFGNLTAGNWYLVHAWHDSVNDLVGVTVNAATANTAAHSLGVKDSTNAFRLSGVNPLTSQPSYDGLIDDVVILKNYILDADERTEDYNSGDGVAFADWAAAGGGTVLVWDLASNRIGTKSDGAIHEIGPVPAS